MRFLIAGLFLTAPLLAHHSFASSYFMDQRTKIEGTLVEFNPRNPHSFVQVEAPNPKTSAMATWAIEWRSAQRLAHEGINSDTLKPGCSCDHPGNPGRASTCSASAGPPTGGRDGQAVQ